MALAIWVSDEAVIIFNDVLYSYRSVLQKRNKRTKIHKNITREKTGVKPDVSRKSCAVRDEAVASVCLSVRSHRS